MRKITMKMTIGAAVLAAGPAFADADTNNKALQQQQQPLQPKIQVPNGGAFIACPFDPKKPTPKIKDMLPPMS